MFSILNNFKTANNILLVLINKLKKNGYHIFLHKHRLNAQYTIDKITVKTRKKTKNRLVLSAGLHGIEGFVGHAAIHTFLTEFLDILIDHTEIVIYPTINPYGMDTNQRTNMNNVDLNRNFSKNNFSLENNNYLKVKDFVEPKEFKNAVTMNSSFYYELGKLIKSHGIEDLNLAFLLGQNYQDTGIYYSGTKYEPETLYIMEEFRNFMKSKIPLIWIDLHSGYGPKDQMSIINSKHEIDLTNDMISTCNYPLIWGANEDDIYDTDGDIIEKLYEIKDDKFKKNDFYGTCFEFGTTGEGTLKSIESLKALLTMNHVRFVKDNSNLSKYATKLMRKQFAPSSEKWRTKAHQDFIDAMNEIIKYKKLV